MKRDVGKISLENLLKYIFVISIILSGSTMYGVLKPLNDIGIISYTFRQISLIVTCLLFLYMSTNHAIKARSFKLLLIVFLYFMIYLIVTRHAIPSAIENMCLPVLLYIGLTCTERSDKLFVDFMNKYENITYLLARISLFFYIGGVVFHIIPSIQMQYTNYGWWYNCDNYFFLHFVNEWQRIDAFGMTIYRNIGIFMEGPGFAGVLQFALWWELFGHKKYELKKIIIFIICLVTTFSTKAYVFTSILLFLFLYTKASNRTTIWKKIRMAMLPIILVLTVAIVVYSLRGKINSVSDFGASSWQIRTADYYAALRAWLSSPFFGVGFYNLDELYKYLPTTFMKGDPTAGILNILAYGGIYMFIGNMVAISCFYFKFKKTKYLYMIGSFLILLFLLLFSSSMQYSYTYLFFLSIGLTLPTKGSLENDC